MKKFLIKVNGNDYEVEVEEVGGNKAQVTSTTTSQSTEEVQEKKEEKKEATPVGGKVGSVEISSPMPGTIWKVNHKPGDEVKQGDTILVLEAMKMENDIVAPKDGVISSVNVAEGNAVESGQLLASMS